MTELEAQLLDMLNQEREEMDREKQEQHEFQKAIFELLLPIAEAGKLLAVAVESLNEQNRLLSEQNQRIIDLLQKPSEGDNLETTLRRVLSDFQSSLTASLEQSLKESKS